MKIEIRLSGSGGQGLIIAGVILAEGSILSNLEAVQSQSYGPEARGGASKAEVIISDECINFPKVIYSDMLVSLTQKSFDQYKSSIKENSIVIVDENIEINNVSTNKIYKLPIIKSANEIIKNKMCANIITLGVITSLIENINKKAIEASINQRVPKSTEKINLEAFELGYNMIK